MTVAIMRYTTIAPPSLSLRGPWQVRYGGTEQENPLEDTLGAKCL